MRFENCCVAHVRTHFKTAARRACSICECVSKLLRGTFAARANAHRNCCGAACANAFRNCCAARSLRGMRKLLRKVSAGAQRAARR
eukprot:4681680-Lingulodinium_polyedra.AAC.1